MLRGAGALWQVDRGQREREREIAACKRCADRCRRGREAIRCLDRNKKLEAAVCTRRSESGER